MHGTAIACLIASCSGEPYTTENHLFTISDMHAPSNIYDNVHALSSHQLLAHATMLSLLHNLNLQVIAEKLNHDKGYW